LTVEVEIGTVSERKAIVAELMPVCNALEEASIGIHKLIIAKDFAETVKRLQGSATYVPAKNTKNSSVEAVGKLIESAGLACIVLSSALFGTGHDAQTRSFFLIHEGGHLVNRYHFPDYKDVFDTDRVYLKLLYKLYDEYLADFHAYEIVDALYPLKSSTWQNFLLEAGVGFMQVASDPLIVQELRAAAKQFKKSGKMDSFLTPANKIVEVVSAAITHLFSNIHYQKYTVAEVDASKSPFVNENAIVLMEKFRVAAEQGMYDVHECKFDYARFLNNFGISYIDTQDGPYCQVTEI
jgi:hypothetical protein